jgi:flagellar protein FliJ
MKRFTFRLDRVLKLRSRLEREQARALAGALREEEARRARLEAAAARLGRSCEHVAGAAGQVAPAGTLRNLGLAMNAAAESVRAAEETHRAAVDSLQTEMDKFGEARRDRRVVERLRERRHEAWEVESSRHEQKEMDGIARDRRAEEGRS